MQGATVKAALAAGEIQGLSGEERKIARRCVSILGVLSAGSMFGVASSLYLVNHHPLLLVALSPLGRHLWLVAPTVDPFAFVAVVLARRMLFYVPCFYLGRALGERGLVWLEARAAWFARFVRWIEALFARSSHAVVVLMAGPTVSALAGMSGMRTRTFVALAGGGLILRAVIVVRFAEWLRGPIETILEVIDEHWISGTIVLVAGMAIFQWRRRAALARADG